MGLYATFVDLRNTFAQWVGRDCGIYWKSMAVRRNFSPWLFSYTKISKARSDTVSSYSHHFPSIHAPRAHPSPHSSVWCWNRRVLRNIDDGIYIRFYTHGRVFNLRRLKFTTLTWEKLIHELLLADDAALLAYTKHALQHITTCFAEASKVFGLEINISKTEVLHQPAS